MTDMQAAQPALPPVHIVIVNFNGWRDTLDCLDSVLGLDYPSYEILLCDNGSSDDSLDRIAAWHADDPAVRRFVIDETQVGTPAPQGTNFTLIKLAANRGFTGGNNAALRHLLALQATGHVWLLNNDTIVAPSSLRALVETAETTPNVGAVGGVMLDYRTPDLMQLAAGGQISTWTGMSENASVGTPRSAAHSIRPRFNFICGGCLLVPMTVLREVGVLDERFFIYAEDADLCIRIAKTGKQLAYSPDAELLHKGGSTTVPSSPFHDFHNLRSSLLFVHKHWPRRFPATLAYTAYRCVLPKVVRRHWHRLPATFRAYRDVFATLKRQARQA